MTPFNISKQYVDIFSKDIKINKIRHNKLLIWKDGLKYHKVSNLIGIKPLNVFIILLIERMS